MYKAHVLIGAPTYDGSRVNSLPIVRILRNPPPDVKVNLIERNGSILTHGFNDLWCHALNLRSYELPVTHFLLMHADIVPEQDNWLEIMLAEMERTGAKVLSAVVAIKNESGLTSTAWDTDKWEPQRFTLTELANMTEPTWTQPDLLINTGLLLVDFREPWVEKICFHMEDKNECGPDGIWRPRVVPEDWHFSRQCHELGIPVYATKAVTVNHRGGAGYSTSNVWGYPTDVMWRDAQFRKAANGV